MRFAIAIAACTCFLGCVSEPAPERQPVPAVSQEPASASYGVKMPKFDFALGVYPATAAQRHEQGVVNIEFSIDGHGNAKELKQIYATAPAFAATSSTYLKNRKFSVPANWEATGSQTQRFTIEFEYSMPCPAPNTQPRVPGATVVAICSTTSPRRIH